ncbi:hypothetical protein PINS_up008303 [Pythium insidiosum]|nr:hypothetical protein PINS_up008303 [Pythium insidiosum]
MQSRLTNNSSNTNANMSSNMTCGGYINPYVSMASVAAAIDRRVPYTSWPPTNETGYSCLDERLPAVKKPRLFHSSSSSSSLKSTELNSIKQFSSMSSGSNTTNPKQMAKNDTKPGSYGTSSLFNMGIQTRGYQVAPDLSANNSGNATPAEWLQQRMTSDAAAAGAGSGVSSTSTVPSFPTVDTSSIGRGSTSSSVASPTTILGMEQLMSEYDASFYSLWGGNNGQSTAPSGPPVAPTQQPMFLPDEEVKVDYPPLADFNQGDLEYIYGTMESAPTTTEPQVERTLLPADRAKRDRTADAGISPPGMLQQMMPTGVSSFRALARSLPGENGRVQAAGGSQPSLTSKRKTSTAKRPRSRQCDHPGCMNRARSHQKCKKHGGAHQCVFEGCTKNSQSRGLCIAHGGGSRCKIEGCTRASQSKGLCKSHGGGEYCAVEGCRKKAHLKHLCRTHGGGVRCKNPKCMKWAQRKGWCMAHAKEMLGT